MCGALEYRDPRRLIAASRIDVVTAAIEQPYGALREINLDSLALARLTQMQANSPLGQRDLSELIAQIGYFDLTCAGQTDGVSADLNLAASSGIGPQRFAGKNWLIEFSIRPATFR